MFTKHLIAFLLSIRAFFCPCDPSSIKVDSWQKPQKVGRLPAIIQESSALIQADSGTLYTLSDGGNPAVLYKISYTGELVDSLVLPLPNRDWESLASDTAGNLYIGDFGNNLNQRTNLAVYKVSPALRIDTILFHYPEQTAFPATKQERFYDCEAMVWDRQQLHLFTKSRSDKFSRYYTIPDSAGKFSARLQAKLPLKGLVTGADISADGETLALLTYGKIYFLDWQRFHETGTFNQPGCLRYNRAGQSEAISFFGQKAVFLTNETGKLVFFEN